MRITTRWPKLPPLPDNAAKESGGVLASILAKLTGGNVPVVFPDAYFDAFNRVRVSDPVSLFDTSFEYDIPDFTWQKKLVSGATINHSGSGTSSTPQVLMTIPGTSGANAVLQTRQYFRYQAGKSQLIKMTAVMGAAVANVTKRIGYFDSNNGVFFEQNGTTDFAVVRRSNVTGSIVDTRVTQANWNLDKMDGNGPSGITIDYSKAQIFVIDIQWLGVGSVRFYNEVNGELYPIHRFDCANVLSTPYMRHANLPLRYSMINTAESAGATMVPVCCAIDSEGGYSEAIGYDHSTFNSADVSVGATETHLLSLRLKDTYNGVVNRGQMHFIDIHAESSSPLVVMVRFKPTVATGTPVWTSVGTDSIAEKTESAITLSGGTMIMCFFVSSAAGAGRASADNSISTRIPFSLDIDGTAGSSTILSITAISLSGTGAVRAGAMWKELR